MHPDGSTHFEATTSLRSFCYFLQLACPIQKWKCVQVDCYGSLHVMVCDAYEIATIISCPFDIHKQGFVGTVWRNLLNVYNLVAM